MAVNHRRTVVVLAACCVAGMLGSHPASAVIKVEATIRRFYSRSRQVVVGEVRRVDATRGLMDVAVTQTVRGPPAGKRLRLQIAEPAGFVKGVKAGQPVVLFVGRVKGAGIHVADAWLKAARAGPATWKVIGKFEIPRAFPGRTSALVRVVADLKARTYSLIDKVMHHTWYKKLRIANLGVRATLMAAADVSGDNRPDLLVVTQGGGVRLFVGGGGYKDATSPWGLAGVSATKAAFGDVNGDGKPDLLLDALWVNIGSKFVAARAAVNLASTGDVLAIDLIDVNEDKKPDALALTQRGTLLVFENPGRTDKAWPARPPKTLWTGGERPLAAHFGDWGDNGKLHVMVIRRSDITRYALDDEGGPPAGFRRLTGETILYRGKPRYLPISEYTASAAMDRNGGDGRLDLFIATRRGTPRDMELINRGFGTYFTNTEAGFTYRRGRGRPIPLAPVAMTAADVYGDGSQEMLLITEKGDLYQFDSPPYPFPK